MEPDAFICHASDDKETVARPLALELERAGLKVWYAEFTLKVGDPLLESIDEGLRSCRFGVVILSHAFFAKKWPRFELEGLANRQMREGRRMILPIWHGVTSDDVANHSPSLANLVALSSDLGIATAARELASVIRAADGGDGGRSDPSSMANSRLMAGLVQVGRHTHELQLALAELAGSLDAALHTGNVREAANQMKIVGFVVGDLQKAWGAAGEIEKTDAATPYAAVGTNWERLSRAWEAEAPILRVESAEGRRRPAGRCHEAASELIDSTDALDAALRSAIDAILDRA